MLINVLLDHPALNILVKHAKVKAPLALLALVALTGIGCGKRGAPVPPKERILQRVDISGFQRGNQIILSWKMPARNAKKGSVLNINRADIYRLAEPITSPPQLSEEDFASRSNLIAAMPITDAEFGLKTLTYKDTLEFAGQAARLRYAIRFVNASGQKAAFSNVLLIEPTSKVAANPSELAAEASQDAIRLKWLPSQANIDASTPVSTLGYNIYRSTSQKEPGKLLNKSPVTNANFNDEFFEFGKEYYYFVRAVSVGTQAEPIESSESNVLKFKAVDTFAPSPPSAITVAAAPTTISIFFAVNVEKDVVGYNIYRSTEKELPLSQWALLTPELLKTNTFQDTKVESGKTYHYYLSATDKFGNVSEPSDIVSETVP
ncbi:MAG: fibronectin type III domain-containing protein [Pyrinomonadaceae bacterium]